MLGFDRQDQARIATAVSEIARNAIRYARDGSIAYEVEGERAPQILLIRVADRGPGIANLDEILDGRYRSTTGMGIGLVGARRLMDQCEIASSPGGTIVLMRKLFDSRAEPVAAAGIERIRAALRAAARHDAGRRAAATAAGAVTARSPMRAIGRSSSRGSIASSRTPTAASSRCTPSSTSRPTTCGAPTR